MDLLQIYRLFFIPVFLFTHTAWGASDDFQEKSLSPKQKVNLLALKMSASDKDFFSEKFRSVESSDWACRFPYKYKFLNSQKQYQIKNIDLKECSKLKVFTEKFMKKRLSLVFASESLSSASSAFGHLFLALHNEKKIEINADVISFGAKVNPKDNFLLYGTKGAFGGYQGEYVKAKFYELIVKYQQIDQRELHIYNLEASEEEIENIVFYLYEANQASFNYLFFNGNCATFIDQLLSRSLFEKESRQKIASPLSVLKKFRTRYKNSYKVLPFSDLAKKAIKNLKSVDKLKFKKVIKNKNILEDDDSEELKLAVYFYYIYNFKTKKKSLPKYLDNLSQLPKELQTDFYPKKKDNIISQKSRSMLSLAYGKETKEESFKINFRPGYRDIYSLDQDAVIRNELIFLEIGLRTQKNKIDLEKFDIFKINNLQPSKIFFDQASWSTYLGINRLNLSNKLQFDFNYGYGKSFHGPVGISLLPQLGFTSSDGLLIYGGAQGKLYSQWGKKLKFILEADLRYFSDKDFFEKYNLIINYELNSFSELGVNTGWDKFLGSNVHGFLRVFF